MRQLFDSFAHFDNFLAYLGVALVLVALFLVIYVRVTPYREIALTQFSAKYAHAYACAKGKDQ